MKTQLCRVLVAVLAMVGCSTPRSDRRCPAIELRVIADARTDSTRLVSDADGRQVLLTQEALLSGADVVGARTSLTEGQWVVNLDLTAESARRLQAFSERNVGRTLAFLVDGAVVRTPRILDPITGNGILLGAFERAEADQLADAITTGCSH